MTALSAQCFEISPVSACTGECTLHCVWCGFHPARLPPAHKLLPISEFGSTSDYLQNAQRLWSSIIHHSEWVRQLEALLLVSTREAVRFIAVSQMHAGIWLNAVPKFEAFAIPTWAMRLLVQRRLGLPLTATVVPGALSKHGREFDVMGDLAANDGHA